MATTRGKKAGAKKAKKAAAKKARPKKTSAKKAGSKKTSAKKARPKKTSAKKAKGKKIAAKKARPKKTSAKKVTGKKIAARKAPPKISSKAEPRSAASAERRIVAEAKKARAKREPTPTKTPRPTRGARASGPARSQRAPELELNVRKRPSTSLPPDHEVIYRPPQGGEPVDKQTAIAAIRKAFEAEREHHVSGEPSVGRRSPLNPPGAGEIDYTIAQVAQRAAEEVVNAAESLDEVAREVGERIQEVYSGLVEREERAPDEDGGQDPHLARAYADDATLTEDE